MGNIRERVFLGVREKYNQKLAILANLAQKEIWTFKSTRETDPYRILRNYFQFTYDRIEEEGKLLTSNDGAFTCMNTGLLTVYDQEIIAIFAKSADPKLLLGIWLAFLRTGIGFSARNLALYPKWRIILIMCRTSYMIKTLKLI